MDTNHEQNPQRTCALRSLHKTSLSWGGFGTSRRPMGCLSFIFNQPVRNKLAEMFTAILHCRWGNCIKVFNQNNQDDGLIHTHAFILITRENKCFQQCFKMAVDLFESFESQNSWEFPQAVRTLFLKKTFFVINHDT